MFVQQGAFDYKDIIIVCARVAPFIYLFIIQQYSSLPLHMYLYTQFYINVQ